MLHSAVVLVLAFGLPVAATQTWVVGGATHPWSESGIMDAVDAVSEPGWIQPIRTTLDQNLALRDKNRVPRAYSLQPSIQALGGLERMIDGDSTTAFQMTLEATVGSSVILDLGAVFPVSLIKFYPRQDEQHKEQFLRAYQLYITDRTLSPQGQILWDLIAPNWENNESVVRVPVANQYVRDVRIQAVTNLQWEIAEWEVYGQGFAPSATYTSDPIDMGGAANFGTIRWVVEKDPAASVTLVTRSGTDPTPATYFKLERPEEGLIDTVEVSQSVYLGLAEADRYRELDLDHWSFWSAPYSAAGLDTIVSPAPRQYFQFRLQFDSDSFTDRARVDSVAIEYSSPPVAQKVVGEVSPGLVGAGERATFTYAISPEIRAGDHGFNALRVLTPLRADVRELRIDGASVSFDKAVEDRQFTVTFPRIRTDGALLELEFDCQVLVYGTVFSGTVFDSETNELPQDVMAGDASSRIQTNKLSVGITELDQQVLSDDRAEPEVFSPNGDGVNDCTAIHYYLEKLLKPGRLEVAIHDLSGQRIWSQTRYQASGVYSVAWDGTGADGGRVPPGTYLYTVTIHTASGEQSRAGTVAVVY